MPLPLTVSCFSKIQIGFTILVPAHLGSPGQRAVKRVCVWGGGIQSVDVVSQIRDFVCVCVTMSLAGTSASWSTAELDPVSEVMSELMREFKDVTRCTDDAVCRKFIELGQMDLNCAVAAYIDAMS